MKMILMLQEATGRITVDRMADLFSVSRRTIFRDLNALSEINVPVTWEEYSGYGILPGYKVPPLMFTSRELATIMVGLNFVKSQVDRELAEDAEGVELKVKNVLPDKLKVFMESLAGRTVVDPFLHYGSEKRSGGSWYLISSAISQQRAIQFSYQRKRDGALSERILDPYLLVFYRDHWNVIGYSHERKDLRNFVLDRMSNIEMRPEKFEPKAEIDAERSIFRFDGPAQDIGVEVVRSSFDRFMANLPTKLIKKSEVNSKIIKATFRFDNLDYINEWLLQFGDKVRVTEPEHLLQMRRDLLTRLTEQAGSVKK
ncbi:MAG: YafY family protein [Balneolaceae bacterium]